MHILSAMYNSLPNPNDFFFTLFANFFRLCIAHYYCFLSLNLRMTLFWPFILWHAWKSSCLTSMPVNERASQTFFSKTLSGTEVGTELISIISLLLYCDVSRAFFLSCTTLFFSNLLTFFDATNSECNSSYLFICFSRRLIRSVICWGIFSTESNLSINSSCYNHLLNNQMINFKN